LFFLALLSMKLSTKYMSPITAVSFFLGIDKSFSDQRGPRWNSERVADLLRLRDLSRNYTDVWDKTYIYGDTIADVLEDEDYDDEDEEDMEAESDGEISTMSDKLPREMRWLTIDPGRQYIGSFHPEKAED